jgi:hypothetical protein
LWHLPLQQVISNQTVKIFKTYLMKNYLLLISFLAFAKLVEAQCSVTAQIVSNVTCFGACDGVAAVNVVTGTPPFTYQWIPASSISATASGLCPGPYAVMITDSTGCQASSGLVVISQPTQFTISVNQTSGQCYGDPGCWDVVVSGATPPYYFIWNTGDTSSSLCNVVTQGVYSCYIVDANGCDTTIQINFTWSPQMFVNESLNFPVGCNGDSTGCVQLIVTGGVEPYYYNSTQLDNDDTLICGLAAGGYTFVIYDSVGCSASAGVTITEPTVLSASVCSQTNVSCNGDSTGCATICPAGGTGPYSYSWIPSGGNSASACNLTAGTYSVIVTDDNGCTTSLYAVITQPPQLIVSVTGNDASCSTCNDGWAYGTPTGGTGPYTYSWNTSPVQTTQTATGLVPGNYTLCVTDANGCSACEGDSLLWTVGLTEHYEISSAVSVYPNPFHSSASIIIDKHLAFDEAELKIYDVTGKKVQSIVLRNHKTEISKLSSGIYWLQLTINNKKILKKLVAY